MGNSRDWCGGTGLRMRVLEGRAQRRVTRALGFAGISAVLLSACTTAPDPALIGDREVVGLEAEASQFVENEALPIALPEAVLNAEWTHPGGNRLHRIPHVAFDAAGTLLWDVDIGQGDARRQRINARPVVAGGAVFTVDADSVVVATSTAGARLWSRSLIPDNERGGQGGSSGLAYGDVASYVTTGYGELVKLDPASGAEIWTQDLDALGGASVTYFDGRVYVAARDSIGWAINAETGRIDWQGTGTPSNSGYVGGAGPAVTDELAIFPFISGELVATFRRGGLQRWNATVLGNRLGVAYAQISDLSADPVVAGNRVYASNPAGRLVAVDLGNGERLWTAREGTISTPAVAGGSLFFVSDRNALLRLDAAAGPPIWSQDLPFFEETRAKRQKTVFAHLGPVLAGGRLWLASSDGALRSFDPVSGAQVSSTPIRSGAATAPVVAGGVMYVVTKNGRLLAFR